MDRRDYGMTLRFVAVTLFMMVASAASADEYHCSDRNNHGDELLRELYTYALFAEAADSGELPPWRCKDATDAGLTWEPQGWDAALDGRPPSFRRLSKADLMEYGWDRIAKRFRDNGRHIGAYESESGGSIQVVCDNNPSNIKLFLTWSEIRPNIDDDRFLRPLIVPIVFAVDISTNASTQEGLRTVTFKRESDLSKGEEDYYPETVTAVPGTDFTKLQELQANWRGLRGDSCVFDFMVAVAGSVWAKTNEQYVFAGHSLGGSVAQYVAQQLAPGGGQANGDGTVNRTNFQAYAFNAIGLDESRGANPKTLHSFYIKGDPVVGLGADKGRIQGGHIVRYTPPSTTSNWSKIKNLWEEATFKWHRLSAVQEGLCECMNGHGNLSITMRSSTRGN